MWSHVSSVPYDSGVLEIELVLTIRTTCLDVVILFLDMTHWTKQGGTGFSSLDV